MNAAIHAVPRRHGRFVGFWWFALKRIITGVRSSPCVQGKPRRFSRVHGGEDTSECTRGDIDAGHGILCMILFEPVIKAKRPKSSRPQ